MKKTLFLSAALIAGLLFATPSGSAAKDSKGASRKITKSYDQPITEIQAGHNFHLEIVPTGGNGRAELEIDSRMEPYLVMEMRGGRMKIGLKDVPQKLQNLNPVRPTARITVARVDALQLSGAAWAEVSGEVKADNLKIRLSGATRLANLKVNTGGDVDIECSGGSRIESITVPRVKNIKVQLSGATRLDNLTAQNASDMNIGLSGSARLNNLKTGSAANVRVGLSGASRATAAFGNCNQLKYSLSGSSRTDLSCQAGSLQAEHSGATQANVSGSAESVKINTSGSARADLSGLKAGKVRIDSSGASNIDCWPTDELHASTSGSSRIRYKNAGAKVQANTSRGSSVSSY